MELKQRVRIPVAPAKVWQGLNDASILKSCLTGCESFEPQKTDDGADAYTLAITAKVGPVKAKFNGEVTLSNVVAPSSYTISGSGKGGVAGFAKGSADVELEAVDEGAATLMTYKVNAAVGGKLAQIGSRLVMGAARKMADDFFAAFVRTLSGDQNMQVEVETLET